MSVNFFATGSLYDVPEDEAEHLVITFQGGTKL
jgi:hypothetical protein